MISCLGDDPSGQVPGLEVKVSVPQTKYSTPKGSIPLTVKGPCPVLGVEPVILNLPLFCPLPVCEYSRILAVSDKANQLMVISGSRSQSLVVSAQTQEVAFEVLHCALIRSAAKENAAKSSNFFIAKIYLAG